MFKDSCSRTVRAGSGRAAAWLRGGDWRAASISATRSATRTGGAGGAFESSGTMSSAADAADRTFSTAKSSFLLFFFDCDIFPLSINNC